MTAVIYRPRWQYHAPWTITRPWLPRIGVGGDEYANPSIYAAGPLGMLVIFWRPGRLNAIPDRIDYDDGGELDDVVVNDCMAHLERLDTGLWYLGLYGSDGRILQVDIGSKTGRAEVTAKVRHNEGIEETR